MSVRTVPCGDCSGAPHERYGNTGNWMGSYRHPYGPNGYPLIYSQSRGWHEAGPDGNGGR